METGGEFMAAAQSLWTWVQTGLFTVDNLTQGAVALGCLVVGGALGMAVRRRLRRRYGVFFESPSLGGMLARRLAPLIAPLISLLLLFVAGAVLVRLGTPLHVLRPVISLVIAWLAANLAAALLHEKFWRRVVAVSVWLVAALNILGVLDRIILLLDSVAMSFNSVRLSLWTVIKAALVLAVLLRIGLWLAGTLERRLGRVDTLTPSTQVLLAKIIKVGVLLIAGLMALNMVGMDLSALAVMGGAVGLGVGFGLQKIFSNLISGFILLMDKSIKPGDVIQLGDVYGWITRLQARYVSVVTRDGTEYLIPNEDLITGQVVNWSYSNTNVRLKVEVGVAYESDVPRAMELVREAAHEVAGETGRVLAQPEPVVLLTGFGDSSVDLELRIWISDPQNGLANVRSDILLRVWKKFNENGVTIPFPQRDVHLDISDSAVREAVEKAAQVDGDTRR